MISPSKIRRARLFRDYSMKQMARGLGIDESTYGRLERGNIRLNEERIKQLTRVLDMSYFFIDHIDDIIGALNTHWERMPPSGGAFDEQLMASLHRIEVKLEAQQKLLEKHLLPKTIRKLKSVGGNKT